MEQQCIFPQKLSPGDEVRVISPAQSMSIISSSVRSIAMSLDSKLASQSTVRRPTRFIHPQYNLGLRIYMKHS